MNKSAGIHCTGRLSIWIVLSTSLWNIASLAHLLCLHKIAFMLYIIFNGFHITLDVCVKQLVRMIHSVSERQDTHSSRTSAACRDLDAGWQSSLISFSTKYFIEGGKKCSRSQLATVECAAAQRQARGVAWTAQAYIHICFITHTLSESM